VIEPTALPPRPTINGTGNGSTHVVGTPA